MALEWTKNGRHEERSLSGRYTIKQHWTIRDGAVEYDDEWRVYRTRGAGPYRDLVATCESRTHAKRVANDDLFHGPIPIPTRGSPA